jgi:hypothetical protein
MLMMHNREALVNPIKGAIYVDNEDIMPTGAPKQIPS